MEKKSQCGIVETIYFLDQHWVITYVVSLHFDELGYFNWTRLSIMVTNDFSLHYGFAHLQADEIIYVIVFLDSSSMKNLSTEQQ